MRTVIASALLHLTVLGADDGGEANLTYTWSPTGPAPLTFSANGTNASKNTTAIFSDRPQNERPLTVGFSTPDGARHFELVLDTQAFIGRRGQWTSRPQRELDGIQKQARQPKVPEGSEKRTDREGRR